MPEIPHDNGEPIPSDEPTPDPPPPGEGDEDGDCIVACDSNGWPVGVGYDPSKSWFRLRLPGAEYVGSPTRQAVWEACEPNGIEDWPDDIGALGGSSYLTTGKGAAQKIADLRALANV